jgi:hypothetical protein
MNVYLEQLGLEGVNGSKKDSESENAKIAGENNVDSIICGKGIFIINLCWKYRL